MQMKVFYFASAMLALISQAYAYTSIAIAPGYAHQSFDVSYDWGRQKDADAAAIKGCQKNMADKGIGKLASKCKVVTRAKGPGYGAVVCGDKGCSWVMGYSDKQEAVDAAWNSCDASIYGNCQDDSITAWLDENWPQQRAQANRTGTCQPPPGKVLRYSDRCFNGDCTRTFENGCSVRFQAPYCFNGLEGKWEWKSDGC